MIEQYTSLFDNIVVARPYVTTVMWIMKFMTSTRNRQALLTLLQSVSQVHKGKQKAEKQRDGSAGNPRPTQWKERTNSSALHTHPLVHTCPYTCILEIRETVFAGHDNAIVHINTKQLWQHKHNQARKSQCAVTGN